MTSRPRPARRGRCAGRLRALRRPDAARARAAGSGAGGRQRLVHRRRDGELGGDRPADAGLGPDGCETVTLTDDTAGTTFTCVATSEGGTSAESVTVKRDATPPSLTCTPTPAKLWPPNGKLIPISVTVDLSDRMSGVAGFLLTDAPRSDAFDFDVGTPDVAGLLRAERAGNGSDAATGSATADGTSPATRPNARP